MHAPLRVSVSYPACLRRLERRLGVYVVCTGKSKRRRLGVYIVDTGKIKRWRLGVYVVGTGKSKRAKERIDV